MTQYIDKDALLAEIERMIKHYSESAKEFGDEGYNDNVLMEQCKTNACKQILSFIDTLEVKEEIKIGETEIYLNDDGEEAPYGKQWLDLSCTEYEIQKDKFKDGDKVELIIRKKKGE